MLRPAPTVVPLTEAHMREYTEARKAWAQQARAASVVAGSPTTAGPAAAAAGAAAPTPGAPKLTTSQRIGLAQ